MRRRTTAAKAAKRDEQTTLANLEQEMSVLVRRALRRLWSEESESGALDRWTYAFLVRLSAGPMRVGEVARLFADAGFICISAFISPHRAERDIVRKLMNDGIFIEVYVNAPLAVCEQRDPKGLYAKARLHRIKNFTGISSPYEPPLKPEIELPTDQLTVAEAVEKVMGLLRKKCGVTK